MEIFIKEATRNKRDWSLYRLAKEMKLPQQTVYSWANGRTQPTWKNIDRLCSILGCAIGEIFVAEAVK